MSEPLTSDLNVQVDGAALPPDVLMLLVLALVEDNRALPDTFELRFRDPDRIAIERGHLALGARVRLGVSTGADSSPTWLYSGEITALEVERDALGSWTVVRGYDSLHRLQRGRRVAAYRDMRAGDIVAEVARSAGLATGQLDDTPVLSEVIQPNLSDWEFLTRLAADLGMQLSASDGKLDLRSPTSAASGEPVDLALGDNLVSFRAAVTASEHVDEVRVRSWDPATKRVMVGTRPGASAAAASIAINPGEVAQSFGSSTMTVTDTPFATQQKHVDALAESIVEQLSGAFAELEAVVRGDPRLRSGAVIGLSGVGSPFEGRYVITSARHVFDGEDGYRTWLNVSGSQDRTLLGLSRGASSTTRGLVTGLVPAIVTDTQDPDDLGRVRVSLPWLDDTLQSSWARTLQLGGRDGGGLMVPEVDDEVLVGFEQGRIERPFVLGGLYNGVDKPATGDVATVDSSSGSISRRAMASRSGNRVEILDAPNGANGVRLATGDGQFVIDLDKRGTTIRVASGGSVVIEGDGDINLSAGGSATIEAGGDLRLKASGNLSAEANANVDVKASASLSLDGQAAAELTSAGQAAVSGARAELKGQAATTISGGLVKIN